MCSKSCSRSPTMKLNTRLLHGLRLAVSLGIKRLLVYSDSLLVVQQVNKEWDVNKDTMDAYVAEIRKLENKFSGLEIHHVNRNNNVGADVLSKLGSTRAAVPPGVFVHELHHPSVKEQSQQATDTEAPATVREVLRIDEDWRTQFIDFIKEFKLPPHVDPKSAEAPPSPGAARVSSSSATTYTSALLQASS